jgi:phage baseplate assembly protein W
MPLFAFGSRRQAVPPTAPVIAPGAEVRRAFILDKFAGGRNISFPLRRDLKGDYVSASGLELATEKVIQILATRARVGAFPGDLAGTPEFGSRLHILKSRILDETTRELATLLTREAINTWLPEITLTAVSAILNSVDNDNRIAGITIDVQFRLTAERTTGELAELTLVKRF